MMKPLGIYLLFVNVVAFALFGIDKHRAQYKPPKKTGKKSGKAAPPQKPQRIPEKTLLMWALIGGSIGASFGMEMFNHKTLHPKFKIGLPLILLLHIIIAGFIFLYGDEIYGKLLLYLSRMRFSSLNTGILG